MKKLFLSFLFLPFTLVAQTTVANQPLVHTYQVYNPQDNSSTVKTPFDEQLFSMLNQDVTIHIMTEQDAAGFSQILKDYTKLLREQQELSDRFDKLKLDILKISLMDNKNIDIDEYQFVLSNDLNYLLIIRKADDKTFDKPTEDTIYTTLKVVPKFPLRKF
jgi:hypothetical protein